MSVSSDKSMGKPSTASLMVSWICSLVVFGREGSGKNRTRSSYSTDARVAIELMSWEGVNDALAGSVVCGDVAFTWWKGGEGLSHGAEGVDLGFWHGVDGER
jgi:hypothetical protein